MPLSPDEQRELDNLEIKQLEAKKAAAMGGAPQGPEVSTGEAMLQGFGQGASLGYIPEMQALAEPALQKTYELATGQTLEPPKDLAARLQDWRAREQNIREKAPAAYFAGVLPGAVTAPGSVAATKGLGAAVGIGALQGAAANPEKPYTLEEQLKARGTGAAVGGALGAAGIAAQKGLSKLYSGTKKALPKVGEYLSGVPRRATEVMTESPGAVKAAQGVEETLALTAIEDTKAKLQDAAHLVANKLSSDIKASNHVVPFDKIEGPMNDYLLKIEQSQFGKTADGKAFVRDARDEVKRRLYQEIDAVDSQGNQIKEYIRPDTLTAAEAFEMQERIKDLAQLRKKTGEMGSGLSKGATSEEKQWANAARKSYANINEELETATKGASADTKAAYADIKRLQETLEPVFADSVKAEKFLANLPLDKNAVLRQRLERLSKSVPGGTDLNRTADILAANRFYGKPSWQTLSGLGSTSTSRTLSAATLGGILGYREGGVAGGMAGAAAGGLLASPAALRYGYIPVAQKTGYLLEKGAQLGKPMMTPAAGISVWRDMQKKEK